MVKEEVNSIYHKLHVQTRNFRVNKLNVSELDLCFAYYSMK